MENYIVDIDELQAHGLLKQVARDCCGSNIASGVNVKEWRYIRTIHQVEDPANIQAQSVYSATTKTLLKIRGFSDAKVEKIKDAVRKCMVRPMEYLTSLSTYADPVLAQRWFIHDRSRDA